LVEPPTKLQTFVMEIDMVTRLNVGELWGRQFAAGYRTGTIIKVSPDRREELLRLSDNGGIIEVLAAQLSDWLLLRRAPEVS
jgi:hypothetical protein